MQTVWISTNPFDVNAYEEFEAEDMRDVLMEQLPVWPKTARLYHKEVALANDVTPGDKRSIDALAKMPGPFYAIVYPADPGTLLLTGAILLISYTVNQLTQDKPKPLEQVFSKGSNNNQLSQRENQARLNQRIPDILGVVRSIPDLIQYPYTIWENNEPVEYSYMCIGRGLNSPTSIKDGDTDFEDITRAAAVVYPPGEAPGGGTPLLVVGEMITEDVYTIIPVTSAENRPLRSIKALTVYGSGLQTFADLQSGSKWKHASFRYLGSGVGTIDLPTNGSSGNITGLIQIDDELQIIWGKLATLTSPKPDLSAGYAFGADGVSPPGPYPNIVGFPENGRVDLAPVTVTAVTVFDELNVQLTVSVPASLQAEWDKIAAYSTEVGTGTGVRNKNVAIAAQNRWIVGYKTGGLSADAGIFIDDPNMEELWVNFVANEGLYAEDTANRVVLTHVLACFITPCDAAGTPTADPTESFQQSISGSMLGNQTRGVTVKFPRITPGRCLVQFACTSAAFRKMELDPTSTAFFRTPTFIISNDPASILKSTAYTGQIHDDVEVSKCYSVSKPDFAATDITTIQTRIVGNPSSKRVEKRQLNCKAARATLSWNGVSFTTPVDLGNFTENMVFHVLKDEYIGNRKNAEIDFATIANAFAFIRESFGDPAAAAFSYTLDDLNMSAEETVATICAACFVIPFRQGDVMKASPDVATDASTYIFNHRNKVPGSEARAITFGRLGDNDGVEQEFMDPDTGPETYIPPSLFPRVLAQPVSPLQSRIVGLRHRKQAIWHGHRQQARQDHQNQSVQFEALEEAGTLRLMERILVEDNTRPDVQDGDVEKVVGLILTTSQPVDLTGGTFTIFVQHAFGAVESIPCSAGTDEYSVVLGHAPALALNSDPGLALKTTYLIVKDQNNPTKAFQVMDREHNNEKNTHTMTCANYSFMYYHADALMLFLPISSSIASAEVFFDKSAYETPNLLTVAADAGVDPLRGFVYEGTNISEGLPTTIISPRALDFGYTIVCTVNKSTGTGTGTILSSDTTGHQFFEVDGSTQLRAGHGDSGSRTFYVVTNLFTINAWHHCALTYSAGGTMRLYLDGVMVDEATGVPNRTVSLLRAFRSQFGGGGGRLIGFADNLRHYCAVLSPAMIRELAQRETFT
jgi:hypothetical protein